jgi:hypothetical protein
MKPSLYLETTIPSYLAARVSKNAEIAVDQEKTRAFYESERHKYSLFVSEYVYRECMKGDPDAAQRRLEYLKGVAVLEETPDVEPLADVYMRLLSIPSDSRIDALHLAICCINRVEFLLTWNCKHLGTRSMQIAQRYNDKHGLWMPELLTPKALIEQYSEVNFNE